MLTAKHQITRKMFIDTLIVMVVAELSGAATCLVDGLITGRFLGNDAMAAFSYSCTYFSIVSIVNGILMVGNQTLCVQAVGKGSKEDVNCLISLSSLLGIGATLLITILMFSFPKQTAVLFGAQKNDAVIMANIIPYFRGVCLGSPFWCLYVVLTPIVQLDGGGKRAKISALFVAIADVALDFILGVVLKMGMLGMGLATSCSNLVGFLIIVSYFFTDKSSYHFTLHHLCFDKTAGLIKNGLPRATSMIARTIGPILLNLIIIGISVNSAKGLTALSVQRSISFCFASLGWGIGGAVLMLGTLFYNVKNMPEIKALVRYSLIAIVALVGLFSLCLIIAAPFLVRAYQPDWRNDTELYNLTVVALRTYILSLPFLAFNVSFAGYIQSVGKNFFANNVNVFTECIFLVLACFILSARRQYIGFFEGFLYGQAALSLLLILCTLVHRYLTRDQKHSLYFIPKDHIVEDEKILQASISGYADIEELSAEAAELCRNVYTDPSRAYKVGLCVEELGCNVLEHGFKKDNKKHIVEMMISVSEQQTVITLIDDCREFDISKKLKTWEIDKEHPEKNIGIRTIMLLARQVIYSNTMNINNLQIIL